MKQIDHPINLDRANGAEDNASKGMEQMGNSSTKMPWYLLFAGNMKTAAAAVVVGIGLLVGSNAEAQVPDYSFYGIDTTWLYEYVGGQWYETLTTVNRVDRPSRNSTALRGVASYRFAAPIQDCPSSGLWTTILRVRSTRWYASGRWRNMEHYTDTCKDGNRYQEQLS